MNIKKLNINRHFVLPNGQKIGRIMLESGGYRGSWCLRIDLGHGSSYRGGSSLYLSFNCESRPEYPAKRVVTRWQWGFTRNTNKVPHVEGTYNIIQHATNFGKYGAR